MTLFAFARDQFDRLIGEFRAYGMRADPALTLAPGEGMLSYYDLERQRICLSLPDPDTPIGKLQLVLLQSTLDLPDRQDVLRLVRLLIPYVVAHELGHHFRHRYKRFTADLWHEEQVANHLAIAATKTRMRPQDKAFCLQKLPVALAALGRQLDSREVPYTSYDNMLAALRVTGEIDETARGCLEAVQRIFCLEAEALIADFEELSANAQDTLSRRGSLLRSINDEYANNFIRYLYYHLGWFRFALAGPETRYIEDFAKTHLGITQTMLPSPAIPEAPGEAAVLACGRAAVILADQSEALSIYFLRRYRALLVAHLVAQGFLAADQAAHLDGAGAFLAEVFDDEDADPLNYLRPLLPPALRPLLPAEALAESPPSTGGDMTALRALGALLPDETDRRLWRVGAEGVIDQAALETLYRLELFNTVDALKHVPARKILDIVQAATFIFLEKDQVLIWEGERTRDVFLLLEGQLAVSRMSAEGTNHGVATIEPGDVIGEMSFLGHAPRSATVSALVASRCLVLKDVDLRALIFEHPSILLNFAKRVVTRLEGPAGSHANGSGR